MEVFEAICTRRSVRRFKADPISRETMEKILEAANMAPSANNRQPWHFTVIDRSFIERLQSLLEESFDQRLQEISEAEYRRYLEDLPIPTGEDRDKVKGLRNFFRSLGGAPTAVIVHIPRTSDQWRRFCNIQDAAAAIENMLLAAVAEGLGTCWMCGPLRKDAQAIKKILGIPDDRELIAIIPVGYPDDSPKAPPKVDALRKTTWLQAED